MSPDKARKIDPSLSDLTDEQLNEVIGKLMELGQLVFEQWSDDIIGSKRPAGLLANETDRLKINS